MSLLPTLMFLIFVIVLLRVLYLTIVLDPRTCSDKQVAEVRFDIIILLVSWLIGTIAFFI